MPCFASIATCAFDPAISCFHRRLSKGMEAFISRMIDAGPAANRPPHMLLEPFPVISSSRALMILLLPVALAACDRQSQSLEQDNAQANMGASEEVAATSGEATGPAAKKGGEFDYRLDRSKAGTPAPGFAFLDPDGGKKTLK